MEPIACRGKRQQSLPNWYDGFLVLLSLMRFPYKDKRELGICLKLTEIQFENTYRGQLVPVSSNSLLCPIKTSQSALWDNDYSSPSANLAAICTQPT